MNRSITDKELEALLQAARAAGDAEGYARAKFEMALERAKGALMATPVPHDAIPNEQSKAERLEVLKIETKQTEGKEEYKTRVTVSMTRAIALDYIKSVAPRIVGPSEIKKNSEKSLDIFISFGTLQRAMAKLVESGEVELVEASRWRLKTRPDAIGLKSVK
jgi:hypothetical protein